MKKNNLFLFIGLGLGIILSTSVIYISTLFFDNNELNENEIVEYAKELGMIYPDNKESDNLDSILNEEDINNDDIDSDNDNTLNNDVTADENDENDENIESVDEIDTDSALEDEAKEDVQEQQNTTETTETTMITFDIVPGEDSYSVTNTLEKAGLIDNASAFNDFLESNSLNRIIRPNRYNVPSDIEESDLIYLITGHKVDYP
ncbi:MAG: hypothetical protein ACK5LV_06360 [Lachnospirales bacterium]